jgi:hypothetical protein
MWLTDVLKRMLRAVTVHGFRFSFRDWAGACTGFSNRVVEMALAHVAGNKVEAAYRRGDLFDKRRQLPEAWAMYRSSPVQQMGDIAPIRSPELVW